MSRTERYLRRPRLSSRTYPLLDQPSPVNRLPERYPVAVEEVPQLIEEVVVNPVAVTLLEPDFRYLAGKNYLRDSACLSVPLQQGGRGVLTPDYWGRAIPLETGLVIYGRIVGGTVGGKGCFRSGKYYNRNLDLQSSKDMPIGFFGAADADKEMEIGNGLLKVGFRSALVLGFAVLNPGKTKRFLLDRWRKNDEVVEDIEKCFSLLQQAGEKPAFMMRVAGVTSRLNAIRPANLYRRAEFVRAAGLLWGEAVINEDHFRSYFRRGGYERALSALDKVSQRKRLNLAEFVGLIDLYVGIFEANCRALDLANTHPSLSKYHNLGHILAASKDNDPMCNTLDFEEADMDELGTPNDFAASYQLFKRHLAEWLLEEVAPNFFSEYGERKEDLIRTVNSLFQLKERKGFY